MPTMHIASFHGESAKIEMKDSLRHGVLVRDGRRRLKMSLEES